MQWWDQTVKKSVYSFPDTEQLLCRWVLEQRLVFAEKVHWKKGWGRPHIKRNPIMCWGLGNYKVTFGKWPVACVFSQGLSRVVLLQKTESSFELSFLFIPSVQMSFLMAFYSEVSPVISMDFIKLFLKMQNTPIFKGRKRQNKLLLSDFLSRV